MKEALIKYKQMLEAEKGKEKNYYIISIDDISHLCSFYSELDKYLNISKLINLFNKKITISDRQNNSPIPIEEKCEELIKKAIKVFLDDDIPFNRIHLYSYLYLLVDEEILKVFKEDEEKIEKLGRFSIPPKDQEIDKFWDKCKERIAAFASQKYVYFNSGISIASGIWGYNKNMNLVPIHTLHTQNKNRPDELEEERIRGIVNLEEFVRKMEENGYDVEISDNYENPKEPTMENYLESLYNGRKSTIDVAAYLEKKESLTKKKTNH